MNKILKKIKEIKKPKEIQILIIKGNKKKQKIIIKGKKGQYNMKWEKMLKEQGDNKKEVRANTIKGLSSQGKKTILGIRGKTGENRKKWKKKLMYNKNKIKEKKYYKIGEENTPIKGLEENKNLIKQNQTTPVIKNPISELENIEKEIKDAIKGITEGYTIELEMKGIGYEAKMKEDNKEEKPELGNNKIYGKNIQGIRKHTLEKNQIEKNMSRVSEKMIKKEENNNANKKNKWKKKEIKKENKKENKMILKVGLSHPVEYKWKQVKIKTLSKENTIIKITGIEKKKVTEIGTEIEKIKKPEPYKGKGIRNKAKKYKEKKGKTKGGKGGK